MTRGRDNAGGNQIQHLRGDLLTINNEDWPSTDNISERFLYYNGIDGGLSWQKATTVLLPNNTGDFSYLVENRIEGNQSRNIKLEPYTNKYLLIGGSSQNSTLINGGPDGQGSGLSGDIKGQLTIGLNKENIKLEGYNNFGASMTDHLSLSHKEIRLIDKYNINEHNIIFPSKDSGLIINTDNIYKRQSNTWTDISNTNEILKNKIIRNPLLDGSFNSIEMNTNVYQGYNSGTNSKTIDKILSEKDIIRFPSKKMYYEENNIIFGKHNYNQIYINPLSNTNEDYKNWIITLSTEDAILTDFLNVPLGRNHKWDYINGTDWNFNGEVWTLNRDITDTDYFSTLLTNINKISDGTSGDENIKLYNYEGEEASHTWLMDNIPAIINLVTSGTMTASGTLESGASDEDDAYNNMSIVTGGDVCATRCVRWVESRDDGRCVEG